VLSLHQLDLALGSLVNFIVQSGAGAESAEVTATVAWMNQDQTFGHFVGLKFCEGSRLPNGSFLDRYLLAQSG